MSTASKRTANGVASTADSFVGLLTRGLWPIAIYPRGAEIVGRDKPAEGKEPIGKGWGLERWSIDQWHRLSKQHRTVGVGVCLGPGRGPDGRWLIDVEGDGPEAEASRAKLFGGEVISTCGWASARGRHELLTCDGVRLAELMPKLAGLEAKGPTGAGVYKSAEHLPGLELRIGGHKPDGIVKQVQSVVPPTPGTDGQPREWIGPETISMAPEAFYDVLASLAPAPEPEPEPEPSKLDPRRATGVRDGEGEGRWTPEARAVAYLLKCDPAVSGQRGHDKAFKAACKIGPGFELHPDTALRLLREIWNPTCEPPWSENDLRRKVDEAYRVETRRGWLLDQTRDGAANRTPRPNSADQRRPAFNVVGADREVEDQPEPINPSDTGNALRLVRDHGKRLRFCCEWGKWLRWDGKRWKEDKSGSVYRLARKTIRSIGAEAAGIDDEAGRKAMLKWAIASESRKHIDAMIHLARYVEGIPVETAHLDRDPWLLNVRNGTIDLQTGRLGPHRREDLITKLVDVDYDPAATCPRWDRFELEIMDEDASMVSYIRRIAGYAITGDVREHMLFFFHGEGRNGKSLWLSTVQGILGDYATTVNASLITSKQHDDHPTGLTDLEGRRFVSTIEVADGKKMAEALVKQLTGGDRIKARRMRQDFYEFSPVHKLILAANHKPEIKGTDEAIWERVKLVPFPVTFVEADRVDPSQKRLLKDKGLAATLVAESPGILATLVRACLEWQKQGMDEPAKVSKATAGYRAEMDRVNDFVEERCVVGKAYRAKANALYEAYRTWAKTSGEDEMTKRTFGANMERRGFENKSSNSTWWRHGIGLRAEENEHFRDVPDSF